MTKQVIRTGSVEDFFGRARNAAQRADKGSAFDGTVSLSFEDQQRMFTALSEAQPQLDVRDYQRTENNQ